MIPWPKTGRIIISIFIITRTASHTIKMNDVTERAEVFSLNESVLLSLTLNSLQDVITHWMFSTANLSDVGIINHESQKVDLKNLKREVLKNMAIVESVVVPIESGGTYSVRLFNTSSNETIALYNRSVMVAGSKSIQVKMLGEANPENLQAGQNYRIGCFASGYAHGPVIWDWSDCVTQMSDCKANWTLADFGKWWSTDLANSRLHVFSNKFYSIGTLRCTVKADTKNISAHLEIFPSDTTNTELMSGFSTIPRNCMFIEEGDSTNISCQMQRFGFRDTMTWLRLLSNGTLKEMTKQNGRRIIHRDYLRNQHLLHFEHTSTSLSKSFILTLNNISKVDEGHYFCSVTDQCGRSLKKGVYILVKAKPNDRRSAVRRLFTPGQNVLLSHGEIEVFPSVKLWYKDGVQLKQEPHIFIRDHGLEINPSDVTDQGLYVVEFVGVEGEGEDIDQCRHVRGSYILTPESLLERQRIAIVMSSVAGLIILGFTIIIVRLLIINARKSKNFRDLETDLKNKELDATLLIFDQLEICPVLNVGYRNDMRTDRLILDRRTTKILGQGNFGIVQQVGLRKFDGTVEPVALKRPLNDSDVRHYRTLYKEICLMSFLGRHPNIVNMIGYVKNLMRGKLFLVMEYCSNGCLLEYLTTTRQLLSSLNLTSYAYQVAMAMEYLGSLGFIHRDLAARNILLTQNLWVAKVADFGLSVQNHRGVDQTGKLELAWRWTAPEALLHGLFSVKSDVWSFGVLLSEIFSHGAIPFLDQMGPLRSFAEKCSSGQIKLEKPKYATEAVYQLMQDCCHPHEAKRITFTNAQSRLSTELSSMDHEYNDKLKVILDYLAIQIADTAFAEETTELHSNRPTKKTSMPIRVGRDYPKRRAASNYTEWSKSSVTSVF